MKRERKPIEDRTLNNIFAAAFDYLKRNYPDDFSSSRALAEKMGVNKSTITNIMRCYTPVTEDAITKLQTACGCIFNLQWLRGQSDVMLAKDLVRESNPSPKALDSTTTAILAVKDEMIELLKREKTEMIAEKDAIIAEKDAHIATLQREVSDLRLQLAAKKGLTELGRSQSERADPSPLAYTTV